MCLIRYSLQTAQLVQTAASFFPAPALLSLLLFPAVSGVSALQIPSPLFCRCPEMIPVHFAQPHKDDGFGDKKIADTSTKCSAYVAMYSASNPLISFSKNSFNAVLSKHVIMPSLPADYTRTVYHKCLCSKNIFRILEGRRTNCPHAQSPYS